MSRLLLVLLFIGITVPAFGQPLPEAQLTLTETTAHLRFLASDELMGRAPGTLGGRTAERYIAEQFRAAGLQEVEGAPGYLQRVPLVRTRPVTEGTVALLEQSFAQGDQMLLMRGNTPVEATASVVYAGYGLEADYDGLDATGKIVVVRFGLPGDAGPQAGMQAVADKQALASDHGAVAVIELYQAAFPWGNLVGFLNRPRMTFDEAAGSTSDLPYFWVHDGDGTLREQIGQADSEATVSSPGLQRSEVLTHNVVGMVPGSNPDKRDEVVILTAHFDHVGAGLGRQGTSPADSIFNGARDNGMGTVAVLNAAKALALAPPERSVLFVAYTAEESGLLGSRYYADHPLVPLNKTIFNLNVDTGGYSDTSIITVVGLGRTTADDAIHAAAAAFDLTATPDPSPDQGLFDRSDNVSLAAKGVPAPTITPGFRAFTDPGVANYYHRVTDEADDNFDFAYLLRFSQVYTRAARNIANLPEAPFWLPGDKYEDVGKALYQHK